jgi:hypothetical protein
MPPSSLSSVIVVIVIYQRVYFQLKHALNYFHSKPKKLAHKEPVITIALIQKDHVSDSMLPTIKDSCLRASNKMSLTTFTAPIVLTTYDFARAFKINGCMTHFFRDFRQKFLFA